MESVLNDVAGLFFKGVDVNKYAAAVYNSEGFSQLFAAVLSI